MTDLDLTALRRIAEAMDSPARSGPKLMLALIDRIEALEAERDEYKKQADCWSLTAQEAARFAEFAARDWVGDYQRAKDTPNPSRATPSGVVEPSTGTDTQ